MIFNHEYCQKRKLDSMEDTFEDEDGSDVEYLTQNQKYGDELLIDYLIRSRLFLYDKKLKEFRDIHMKENGWTEIASILEISVSDCQLRWLRLRQRFSKERQLRENETRSGAGKPKRQKWVLFDNLNFLDKIVTPRRTYSNVTEKISCMNTQSFMQKPTQNEMHGEIYSDNVDNMELHSVNEQSSLGIPEIQSVHSSSSSQMQPFTPSLAQYQHKKKSSVQYSNISDMNQPSFPSVSMNLTPESTPVRSTPSPMLRSTPSPMLRSTPSPMLRSTPSPIRPSFAPLLSRTPASETNDSLTSAKMLNTPLSCTRTSRPPKKPNDTVETAFCQMNTTLNTMASTIFQNRNDNDIHDPDVIIGKLVTAELKRTDEEYLEKEVLGNYVYS